MSLQELMQFRTSGGKVKNCELTLLWPEEMAFTATASSRLAAEKKAAALACMKLKVRQALLNNHAITYMSELCQELYHATCCRSWSCWIKTTTHSLMPSTIKRR